MSCIFFLINVSVVVSNYKTQFRPRSRECKARKTNNNAVAEFRGVHNVNVLRKEMENAIHVYRKYVYPRRIDAVCILYLLPICVFSFYARFRPYFRVKTLHEHIYPDDLDLYLRFIYIIALSCKRVTTPRIYHRKQNI